MTCDSTPLWLYAISDSTPLLLLWRLGGTLSHTCPASLSANPSVFPQGESTMYSDKCQLNPKRIYPPSFRAFWASGFCSLSLGGLALQTPTPPWTCFHSEASVDQQELHKLLKVQRTRVIRIDHCQCPRYSWASAGCKHISELYCNRRIHLFWSGVMDIFQSVPIHLLERWSVRTNKMSGLQTHTGIRMICQKAERRNAQRPQDIFLRVITSDPALSRAKTSTGDLVSEWCHTQESQ